MAVLDNCSFCALFFRHVTALALIVAIAGMYPNFAGAADSPAENNVVPKEDIQVLPDNNIEKDNNKIKDAGKDAMNSIPTVQEKTESGQPEYPGVINKRLAAGGNGEPSVELYYPFFDNQVVDAAIRAFVDKQATEYEQEVKDGIEPGEEPPSSYGMWEMTGYFSLEKPSPDIVSIAFNIYSYSGGAHGNLVITCLNFNLKTGKRIEFADLFTDPEKALEMMSEFSASRLKAELGEDAEDDMILNGTAPDLSNFSNLTLVPDGLFIEFQPYQVGPWAIGPQRVAMTLADLAPAGPEKDIWPSYPAPGSSGTPASEKDGETKTGATN